MTATILFFPLRPIRIEREPEGAWLVITARGHAWGHGNFADAIADAREVATGFGVSVLSTAARS
jgi:hypothetical protein